MKRTFPVLALGLLSFACSTVNEDVATPEPLGDGGLLAKAGEQTRYEAEDHSDQRGCRERDNHDGYTGRGFVDFGGDDTWIEWNQVRARSNGSHELHFRYANGRSSNRPAVILVNGERVAELSFDSTSGWSNWSTQSIEADLQQGNNTIRVRANTGSGGPNLDHMIVVDPDLCPDDPDKLDPGVCGCGVADTDSDGDAVEDCLDECSNDPQKASAGECGCGTPEGQCQSVTLEAEEFDAQSGCSRRANHDGFTGSGFMDYGGQGTWIEWRNVSAGAGGDYQLQLRYANGSGGPRRATLSVNGRAVSELSFSPTGGWAQWGTEEARVLLRPRNNTIRVTASTGSGGPNIDHAVITPAGTADGCPDDPSKLSPGVCGCGVPEGSCGGGGQGESISLPIEVLGPAGTQESVRFDLDETADTVTHLRITCHGCGYHNHALDSDPRQVKAAVQVNGGDPVALKHYTLGDDGVVGNRDIELVWQDDDNYGGIGGAFRTNEFVLPVSGLKRGSNTLSFTHVDADSHSIGFRIVDFNLLRSSSPDDVVLPEGRFQHDDPAQWTAADAVGTTDSDALQAAIREGKALWYRNGHLYDRALDELDGVPGGPAPLDGRIQASCSDCHAQDGRDLAYFNYSNRSIVERSFFHGVPREDGRKIAAYIRSLGLPVVAQARPWNPPYQPGPGLDSRPAYEWAAGAGIEWVLDSDAEMEPYLFPRGTSSEAVAEVVDRFGTLNMRELPVAVQMPDWNQWLPVVHPVDAFDPDDTAVQQDGRDRDVGMPFYDYVYQRAATDPSPRNLGDMAELLEKWLTRGGTCYTQTVHRGPGWRTTNSKVVQALQLGDVVPYGIGRDACERVRHDPELNLPLDLAKRGLIAWATVKQWEIIHGNDLETLSSQLTDPVCIGGECVDASEARGWVTTDRHDVGTNVFNRAPHYVGYNARHFVHQERTLGEYENSIWYHLQMVLNSGYRRTGPNHYIYTIDHLEYMERYSGASQSFRFWAGMIKMRQSQTTGRYGVEHGLEPHSAQPYRMYSDKYGETRIRAGVGSRLWRRLLDAMLLDFVEDARRGDWSDAMSSGDVQEADSRDFDLCERCFDRVGSPHPFPDREMLGTNTARLIPQLRDLGVSESVIQELIDWGESTWRNGPWDRLR